MLVRLKDNSVHPCKRQYNKSSVIRMKAYYRSLRAKYPWPDGGKHLNMIGNGKENWMFQGSTTIRSSRLSTDRVGLECFNLVISRSWIEEQLSVVPSPMVHV